MPQAPMLDVEQRRAGYDRSLQLRRQRAEVKRRLTAGELDLYGAFELDEAGGMKVRDLLRALPGVGQRRADRLMQTAGVHPARTVAQLGPRQKNALVGGAHSLKKG